MIRLKPIVLAAGLSSLTLPAFAGPIASDLDCFSCVDANEIKANAVDARALADDAVFARTIVVRADGTPKDNCDVLIKALAITSGADADNPYLIKLDAGIYDCEFPDVVEMNPYVDIEGSGQSTTVIQGYALPVVRVAENSEIRQLTVVALGLSRGVEMRGMNASAAHLTVEAYRTENGSIPTGISIGQPTENPSTIPVEVNLDHVTVRAGLSSDGPLRDPGEIIGTALHIGGPSLVRMTDVVAEGARVGLNVVAANAAEVGATASKFIGRISSVRVEVTNTGVIVSSQLIGPIGPGAGALHCIASYGPAFNVLDPTCLPAP
ncbi:MAG: hypothetical protein AAF493_23215 [Pseudomonadota bacterium]